MAIIANANITLFIKSKKKKWYILRHKKKKNCLLFVKLAEIKVIVPKFLS
jgi:hypothetical protein